jgi:hypothetical protein
MRQSGKVLAGFGRIEIPHSEHHMNGPKGIQ